MPAWPLRLFTTPVWAFLELIGVTQKTEFEQPLKPNKKYMIACSPHGAYAFSGIVWVAPQFRLADEFKDTPCFFGAASAVFYVPFVRELLLLCGVREVNATTLARLAGQDTPYSVALIPGGMHEQICTRNDEERHYVQKRLGFIRLAIELGLDIVPMYGFGENQLFTVHLKGLKLRHWLLKKMKVGVPFISGRFGFTLAPHPIAVTHVYGRAISVTQKDAPSEDDVVELYGRYKAELTRLFTQNAGRLLPPEVAAKGIKILRIGVDPDS